MKSMETADEILRKLKEEKAAGKLLKRYRVAKRHVEGMEHYRPSLLGVIGAAPGRYEWDDFYRYREKMKAVNIPKEDEGLLTEYIDSVEIISIIETAVRERLNSERRAEAEDMFLNSLSTAEILAEYKISERTVRRLWKKGITAIENEMACRIGCGRALSTRFF